MSFAPYLHAKSGTKVSIHDPQPDQFKLDDIAWGLSNTCRYGGQCNFFYSVAEHCCELAEYTIKHLGDVKLAKHVLLHDASEAYLGDIPAPLKQYLRDYQRIEAKFESVIAIRFGLNMPKYKDAVKDLDTRILKTEAPVLVGEDWFPDMEPLEGTNVIGFSPRGAYRRFLKLCEELNVR